MQSLIYIGTLNLIFHFIFSRWCSNFYSSGGELCGITMQHNTSNLYGSGSPCSLLPKWLSCSYLHVSYFSFFVNYDNLSMKMFWHQIKIWKWIKHMIRPLIWVAQTSFSYFQLWHSRSITCRSQTLVWRKNPRRTCIFPRRPQTSKAHYWQSQRNRCRRIPLQSWLL